MFLTAEAAAMDRRAPPRPAPTSFEPPSVCDRSYSNQHTRSWHSWTPAVDCQESDEMDHLPTEALLLIFDHTASNSHHDLISLSETSRQLYFIYLAHARPILLRALHTYTNAGRFLLPALFLASLPDPPSREDIEKAMEVGTLKGRAELEVKVIRRAFEIQRLASWEVAIGLLKYDCLDFYEREEESFHYSKDWPHKPEEHVVEVYAAAMYSACIYHVNSDEDEDEDEDEENDEDCREREQLWMEVLRWYQGLGFLEGRPGYKIEKEHVDLKKCYRQAIAGGSTDLLMQAITLDEIGVYWKLAIPDIPWEYHVRKHLLPTAWNSKQEKKRLYKTLLESFMKDTNSSWRYVVKVALWNEGFNNTWSENGTHGVLEFVQRGVWTHPSLVERDVGFYGHGENGNEVLFMKDFITDERELFDSTNKDHANIISSQSPLPRLPASLDLEWTKARQESETREDRIKLLRRWFLKAAAEGLITGALEEKYGNELAVRVYETYLAEKDGEEWIQGHY